MLYYACMNKVADGTSTYRLLSTLGAIEHRLETALEPAGLSLSKFGLLSNLVEAGEALPLRTLAERCACVRSNITQLVDRLEAEKLVIRVDDPHDRRSVRAAITSEGRARYTEGVKVIHEVERKMFSRLSKERAEELLASLSVLAGER
jgi:DNA-binding MarR family transcriptional regulator